jgi:hypothetical protein
VHSYRYLYTKLHVMTAQKTAIFIVTMITVNGGLGGMLQTRSATLHLYSLCMSVVHIMWWWTWSTSRFKTNTFTYLNRSWVLYMVQWPGYTLHNLGFNPWQRQEIPLFPKMSEVALGPSPPPIQWKSGVPSKTVKWLGHEIIQPHLVPRLRMSRAVSPLHLGLYVCKKL